MLHEKWLAFDCNSYQRMQAPASANGCHSKPDRRKLLIVTADDFGYSRERNIGIVECYLDSVITRATLLVNGLAAGHAVQLAKKHGLAMNLHLNVTEGEPICQKSKVPTLLNNKGTFGGKHGFREQLHSGNISLSELNDEIRAQILRYKELTGFLPRGVDGHQHVHVLPEFRDVFAQVLQDFGVQETRLPFEAGLEETGWINGGRQEFYKSVLMDSLKSRQRFCQAKIRFTDVFVGMATMGKDMTSGRLRTALRRAFTQEQHQHYIPCTQNGDTDSKLQQSLTAADLEHDLSERSRSDLNHVNHDLGEISRSDHDLGERSRFDLNHDLGKISRLNLDLDPSERSKSCELMVHPGYCTPCDQGGCGDGPDDFSMSLDREHEMNILRSKEFQSFVTDERIVLVSHIPDS